MNKPVSVCVTEIEAQTYYPGPLFTLPACSCVGREELYPYAPMRDMSSKGKPARHRVVVLENEFLRAEILPDMGGRLYRLFDKRANHDVFEHPGVVKFQNVGNRGAWLSGGIEFNFGFHGHTHNTVSPVSWAIRQEPDGTASVWVGSVVMPTESRWALRISLNPTRAVLNLDIHAMAPNILPGNMYWWSNAAVEVTRESTFYYYGQSANDVQRRHSWPFLEGVDLRLYRNRLTGSDMFLVNPDRDDMAVYDFKHDAGVANVADRFAAPGQKYFTWGNSPSALYWDLLLSDTPGHAYAEIQRGRNSTQADSDCIPPMSEDNWLENWLPLEKTGGFTATQNDLILVLADAGSETRELRVFSLRPFAHLTIRAWSKDRLLLESKIVRLDPTTGFAQPLPASSCDRVEIVDFDGAALLTWNEYAFDTSDWQKAGFEDPLPGPDTPEKLFIQAEKARFLIWPRISTIAMDLYNKVLASDAGHVGTNRALAEIAFHRGDYDGAFKHLQTALLRAPSNPDLLVLLGWTHFRRREDSQALSAFSRATRNEPARRRGFFGLAWLHMRAGALAQADAAVAHMLQGTPSDKWGRLLRAMIDRKAGRIQQASEAIRKLQDDDPLWTPVTAEALLLGLPSRLGAGERRLADDAVYAASPYLELNFWEDAAKILALDESNEPFSPATRLATLVYVFRKLGHAQAESQTLDALRTAPVEQAHPWCTTTLDILRVLTTELPNESMLHLLLGNALAGRSLNPESAWQQAYNLGMRHPVLLANLASLAKMKSSLEEAGNLYRAASKAAPADVAIFLEADRFWARQGKQAERQDMYNRLPVALQTRSIVGQRRVLQLLDAERYGEALDFLLKNTFYRGELEASMRTAYLEAVLGVALPMIQDKDYDAATKMLSRGLEYPRNINIGKAPDIVNEAIIRYWLGLVASMAGRQADAREHWFAAATEPVYTGGFCEPYVMLAFHALGDAVNARRMTAAIEQTLRGERPVNAFNQYFNTGDISALNIGLVHLIRGKVALARQTWKEGLQKDPDIRLLRLHVCHMSDDLLQRIAAGGR